jgi:hypothetical protein
MQELGEPAHEERPPKRADAFGGCCLCERTREDAFNLMIEHAREHGANA